MKIINRVILFALTAVTVISCSKKSSTTPVVPPPPPPVMGQIYDGGIVFYIDSTGQHGMMAAESDQPYAVEWGCEGTLDGAYGNGSQNTFTITNKCDSAGIAAAICVGLNSGGHTDWFLPSKSELDSMYVHLYLKSIGGFAGTFYWSSTEYNASNAWFQYFDNGFQSYDSKSRQFFVRAARAF